MFLSYGSHSVTFDSVAAGMASGRSIHHTLEIPTDAKKVIVIVKVKQDMVSALSGLAKLDIANVEIIC